VDGDAAAAALTLGVETFSVAIGETTRWWAAHRDVARVGAEGGVALVDAATGPEARHLGIERLGPALGTLIRGLRDGRLRQWLADGLVDLAGDEEIELVEYAGGSIGGVASILYHGRGVAVVPIP